MSNQAAYLDAAGKEFRIADAPMPKAIADHVIIKNHAIAINPVDWKVQATGFFIRENSWPVVLGCDVAGEIVEVGSDVKGFKVGDRVAA